MAARRWSGRLLAAVWLAALAWFSVVTAATAAEPLPAEAFFKRPDIERALLSPSGQWLAVGAGRPGGRTALVVFDLQNWGQVRVAAGFSDADIRSFAWVNDERLVFDLIDRESGGGDQPFGAGLFSVKRDGSELRLLVRLRGDWIREARTTRREPLEYNHLLLHVPADGSDDVIVGEIVTNNQGELRELSPKRLNVVTGRVRNLAEGTPPDTRDWWFDAQGRPRIVLTSREGRERLFLKADEQSPWKPIAEFDRYRAPFVPRFFDAAGDLFVTVSAGPEGYAELRRFDFAEGRPAARAVVSAPGFDFRGRLISETPGGKTLGVRLETDAETSVWFDPRLKDLQQQADERLPGRVNRLSCRRCDQSDMVVLIESFADRDPGTYVLVRADTKDWRVIGRSRAAIDPAQMAAVDFHRIKARDGRDLPVWVTTPAAKAAGPRPAVVLVHGGPWLRGGHWRWEPLAQFLASRGYLVIEPEFRGSTGYGSAHFRAGLKQWGLAMQDDVADALQWAVAQGLADGGRACIAGASYGGYATLMGLVRHPELYRCGAAWVAVTDPRLMYEWRFISDQGDEVRQYDYPALIGDPVKDAAQLAANAPVAQAARIKAPLLLAAGALDRRVPLVHATRLREALTEAGRPPEWVVYDDEGHGWLTLKNQLDFANRLEAFLARHLKAATAAAPR
ncbi:MAG: prolyl oligopeptidase family serine peptidase [Rubrivivax sp.]